MQIIPTRNAHVLSLLLVIRCMIASKLPASVVKYLRVVTTINTLPHLCHDQASVYLMLHRGVSKEKVAMPCQLSRSEPQPMRTFSSNLPSALYLLLSSHFCFNFAILNINKFLLACSSLDNILHRELMPYSL